MACRSEITVYFNTLIIINIL